MFDSRCRRGRENARAKRCAGIGTCALTLLPLLAACSTRNGSGESAVAASSERHAGILRAEDRRVPDELLAAGLTDPDPALRRRAVRARGRVGGGGARVDLERALADADAQVRAEAVWGLGYSRDPASIPALRTMLDDPEPGPRGSAAWALGRMSYDEFETDFARLLGDRDPGVRGRAAVALAHVARPERREFAVPRLMEQLDNESSVPSGAAAYALARVATAPASAGGAPGVRQQVREFLVLQADHRDPAVRRWVAAGLAAPESPAERTVLIHLTSDGRFQVRLAAVRSLLHPGAHVDDELDRLLGDSRVPFVWTVLEGLGRMGGATASDLLVSAIIDSKSIWLRERAILSLNQANPQLAAQVANGLSRERQPVLRAATAGALAGGGDDPQILEIAQRLFADSDRRVRAAAVAGLVGPSGPVSGALAPALADGEPLVRAAAARVAGGRLASPASTDEEVSDALSLLRALWAGAAGERWRWVREAVIDQAARRASDLRAAEIVRAGLDDPDRRVRLLAVQRLRETLGEEHGERLGPAADRPLREYVRIVEWARRPRAAVITVGRPGFRPGRFTVRLSVDEAPLTCWSFARLAESGYFDGTVVQRVIPGLFVQDGDPVGDGTGEPGYAIRDELRWNAFDAGTLGMASRGRDTAGSQWFVTLTDQPAWGDRYTAFGRVVQNFEGVVTRIERGDVVLSVRVYEGDGKEPLPPL